MRKEAMCGTCGLLAILILSTCFAPATWAEREPFSIVALPDTQFYSQTYPDIFAVQTQWIRDHRDEYNIVYVAHLGDIVQYANETYQWFNAYDAIHILDDGWDLPYGLCVGNHDQHPMTDPDGTSAYNLFFPYTRYEANTTWYGGHYGDDNDNHFVLFESADLEFIAIHLEYDANANPDVLAWVNDLLALYSHRRAIINAHYLINASAAWGSQGSALYHAVKHNPNLFLMMCGHIIGETTRTDTYGGGVIHTLLADYQGRPDGGQGWLRILEFRPDEHVIQVKTYSPWLDLWETDWDSQFTIEYDMTATPLPQAIFQQGLAGYTGTRDTHLAAATPDTPLGDNYFLEIGAASSGHTHALLRFEDLIGDDLGRIPPGATIASAELRFFSTNPTSNNDVNFHRMLIPWEDTATWNSFTGGIQPDGIEATISPDATLVATGQSGVWLDLDVTDSLKAWIEDQAPNYGWALLPTGSDAWHCASAEGIYPPTLVVRYDDQAQPGDLNCDGVVDFDDIGPFVLALSGQVAYDAQWPDCRWLNGDLDDNGQVDFDDITPFINLLGS